MCALIAFSLRSVVLPAGIYVLLIYRAYVSRERFVVRRRCLVILIGFETVFDVVCTDCFFRSAQSFYPQGYNCYSLPSLVFLLENNCTRGKIVKTHRRALPQRVR